LRKTIVHIVERQEIPYIKTIKTIVERQETRFKLGRESAAVISENDTREEAATSYYEVYEEER
jgi:aminoglycoside N3'-acetyltransferase